MNLEGYCNESYFRNVNKIIVGMEAIDRKGLIAILTSSIGNDEMDDSEQAVMVYNELIDKLQLNIPKDVDYRPNIYSYFGIQKSQMTQY